MKIIDTREYVGALRELTDKGEEAGMIVAGSSMAPFLVHQRDAICFKKPEGELQRGDMVFYQRSNGQFIMHRICRVGRDGFYLVGDAQTEIEGPIAQKQIFARITRVRRKGKWIGPEDFWWKFFEKVWIRMIPLRPFAVAVYSLCVRKKK